MINIKTHEKICKLRIMDIFGQVVHFSQPQSEQFQIDISDLREGVYFVQILTKEGYTVKRIQIAR